LGADGGERHREIERDRESKRERERERDVERVSYGGFNKV
jgi:hypothetical protein